MQAVLLQDASAQICQEPLRAASGTSIQSVGCPGNPEPPQPTVARAATFVGDSVPSEMVIGQQYPVSVSMQNTGSQSWSAAQAFRLGSQNPGDNTRWGLHRVDVSGSVHTGGTAVFSFTAKAPSTPGTYSFQWRMVQDGVAWFGATTTNRSITVYTSTVTGNLEGVYGGNIEGWACSTRINQPIDVHLYVGGAAGVGTGIGAFTANLASESAVGSSCLSGGAAHRFRIPISQQVIAQHAGKLIYIHGISPVGTGNPVINGSGAHRIPQNQAPSVSLVSPPQGEIVGEGGQTVLRAQASDPDDGVASVTFYANGQSIGTRTGAPYEITWTGIPAGLNYVHAEVSDTRGAATASGSVQIKGSQIIGDIGGISNGNVWGWACATFVDSPIELHMYLGGAAGTGVGVLAHTANAPSDAAVATACKANGSAYSFSIPITEQLVQQHGGKAIYLHGISPWGGPNHTINRSGTFQIPANQAPTVAMTSPTPGNFQTPVSFTLKAAASDADDGVAKVTFYANDQAIYTATQAPYQFPVANLTEGTHTYHAVAEDTRGATTTSASVSIEAIRVPWTPPLIPGGRPSVKRQYVYDEQQQLCKVIEPETGATVMGYDGAGNLIWSASGLSLPDATQCNRDIALASGRVVNRTYDARNRLHTLAFPDQQGNQTRTYTATSQPKTITTQNSDLSVHGGSQVINVYDYYRRGLLKGESVSQPGWYAWGIGYGYDRNANLHIQTYPTNLQINYAPNALGQPTQARDQTGYAYATGVSYYPNGAIKQFTYGNGIVHSMGQNARQLPSRVISSGGVLDNEYSYDRMGNVTAIRDLARGDHYSRWMTYDPNDRLLTAQSLSFGGDATHRFSYDGLDNLTSWTLGGVKDYASYVYDPVTRRLGNIKNSAGATIVGLDYDPQGNLENRNGQVYDFDLGNRLRAVAGKETYRYDGQGRRVLAWEYASQANVLSQYSQAGQILYQENQRAGKNDENIYLAGSLIAIREWTAAGGYAAKFQHTDALGSPVAVTSQAGQVVERNEYEPYGAVIGKLNYQGIGYTGHVQDAATGLTYMQQRYYDPACGCFLSVDPVTAYDNGDMRFFNRYAYAFNNPYKFTDPDGRAPPLPNPLFFKGIGKAVVDTVVQVATWRSHAMSPITPFGYPSDPVEAGGYRFGSALMVAEGARGLGQGAGSLVSTEARLANSALVVRGGSPEGANSVAGLAKGTGTHPAGVTGFSAESANGASLCQLCANVNHNQVGVTTVGQVRAAGGDVVSTAGVSPTHATVTGLKPEAANRLFTPTQPNPVPAAERIKRP